MPFFERTDSSDRLLRFCRFVSLSFNVSYTMIGFAMIGLGVALLIMRWRLGVVVPHNYTLSAHYIVCNGILLIIVSIFCWFFHGDRTSNFVYGSFLLVVFVGQMSISTDLYEVCVSLNRDVDAVLRRMMLAAEKKPQLMDNIQTKMRCCGRLHYVDWTDINLPVPKSCCKNSAHCKPENIKFIHTKGCLEPVVNMLTDSLQVAGVMLVPASLMPLLGALVALGVSARLLFKDVRDRSRVMYEASSKETVYR